MKSLIYTTKRSRNCAFTHPLVAPTSGLDILLPYDTEEQHLVLFHLPPQLPINQKKKKCSSRCTQETSQVRHENSSINSKILLSPLHRPILSSPLCHTQSVVALSSTNTLPLFSLLTSLCVGIWIYET